MASLMDITSKFIAEHANLFPVDQLMSLPHDAQYLVCRWFEMGVQLQRSNGNVLVLEELQSVRLREFHTGVFSATQDLTDKVFLKSVTFRLRDSRSVWLLMRVRPSRCVFVRDV
jgi:hypothetical protein